MHLLLEMNAHVNYDLPQAILEVVSDEEFRHPVLMAMRRRDHERIDTLISAQVGAEDRVLPGVGRSAGRLLAPLDRWSTRRFLPAARRQVWANVLDLHEARCIGPDAYAARLIELDVLTSAQIADLLRPGPVLLRLAACGFGVRLPPP